MNKLTVCSFCGDSVFFFVACEKQVIYLNMIKIGYEIQTVRIGFPKAAASICSLRSSNPNF